MGALRCFVPEVVAARLEAGQSGHTVAEHRKLTSVFMKINGLGPSNCEVGDAVAHRPAPGGPSSTHRAPTLDVPHPTLLVADLYS